MSIGETTAVISVVITVLSLAVFIGAVIERLSSVNKRVKALEALFDWHSESGPAFVPAVTFREHEKQENERRQAFLDIVSELKTTLKSLEAKFDEIKIEIVRIAQSKPCNDDGTV